MISFLTISGVVAAQDTLPKFTLLNKGAGRIIISWSNPFGRKIHQLSIQRSADSLKNFKSILTLPDPTVPENGFADTKAPADNLFYRLYILLDSGKYIFSNPKRPTLDMARPASPVTRLLPESSLPPDSAAALPAPAATGAAAKEPKTEPVKPVVKPREVIPEKVVFVKRRDTLVARVPASLARRYRDSVLARSRDTVVFNNPDTIFIRPFVPKEVYRPSKFVFTDRDGNVKLMLPLAAEKKYTLKFFDDRNIPALEIKQIKDSVLTLDKSNFIHAGWFSFELFEDGLLKEKHKLYIGRDF